MDEEEKGMKKKSRGLLILLAVLVALLAVYAGLRAWNSEQDRKAEEEAEAEEIHVTDTDASEIDPKTVKL